MHESRRTFLKLSAGSLSLLLHPARGFAATGEQTRVRGPVVAGRVLDDETNGPVSGAMVSNGLDVVRSTADGAYALPRRPESRFIALTKPTGRQIVGPFYRRLSDTSAPDLDFRVRRIAEDGPVRFALLGDIHVADPRPPDFNNPLDRLMTSIEWACRDAQSEGAQFVLTVGDLTHKGRPGEFRLLRELMDKLALPLWPLPGNHDVFSEDASYLESYERACGPRSYSFDVGGLHVCMYDLGWKERGADRAWLENDLAQAPEGQPCALVLHDGAMPSTFFDTLPPGRLRAVLAGHWHTTRCFATGGRRHLEVNPIFNSGSLDGSPASYRLVTIENGVLSAEARVYGAPRDMRSLSFRALDRPSPAHPARATVRPGGDWPTVHGVGNRRAIDTRIAPPFECAWRCQCPGGMLLQSPIVADGCAFVPSQDEDAPAGFLTAIDIQTGRQRWFIRCDAPVKYAAAATRNLVIFGTITGEVIACDQRDGQVAWRRQLGDPCARHLYQAPAIIDDSVLVGTAACFMRLKAESGEPVWEQALAGEWAASYGAPVVDGDAIFVGFGGQSDQLWRLDAATGKPVWKIPGRKRFGDGCSGAPVLSDTDGPQRMVYYHRRGLAIVAAFAGDGQVNWTSQQRHQYSYGTSAYRRLEPVDASAPGAGFDIRLFSPRSHGALVCLEAREGRPLWEWTAPDGPVYIGEGRAGLLSSPLVTGDLVHVSCLDGTLRTLSARTGQEVASTPLTAPSQCSPTPCGDALLVADAGAVLSCLVPKA